MQFQPQNAVGIGEDTGDKYEATGVTMQNFRKKVVGDHVTITTVNNFKLIGQGKGNNLLVHENVRLTINFITGELTVEHDNFNFDCK
jgi:hypothetical protein